MGAVLVTKPQFDTAILRPGKAVRVRSKDRNDFYNFNYDCLVTKAQPLEIQLAYVKERNRSRGDDEDIDYGLDYKTLPVNLVADGTITIDILDTKGDSTP